MSEVSQVSLLKIWNTGQIFSKSQAGDGRLFCPLPNLSFSQAHLNENMRC